MIELRIIMATIKEFHKRSDEHGGVKAGTKFKLLKDHHELQGDISAGVELALEDIVHYPTRYRLRDDEGNIWLLPIHSVSQIAE